MKPQNRSKKPILREKPILLGYAVQRKGADGRVQVDILWGRFFATALLLLVVAWLSVAGALYFYFKYKKDFDEASYTGMLALPFRMDAHRKEMGDYHIEKALELFKEGEGREAFRLLRIGVIRAPANLKGRRTLSELYEIGLKRSDIAANLMVQGLDLGGIEDLDYLKATLRVLLRHQMDTEIQRIADAYLPEEVDLSDTNRTIAFGAANANYLRGNYDRADDYLLSYSLNQSLEGILLSSQISWDRGNKLSAINKLEESVRRYPNSEPLLMQLSKYHRELGNIDDARRYAILRNVADPLSAAPRIELLYIYNKSGDTDREERETLRMLQQFREDESALQSLANFAAETGNIELARRTYEEALENEFSIEAYALLLIESHLVDKDYEGALNFAEELLKERPEWLTSRWAIFNSLRAVASYGINRPDLGEIYLQDFIDDVKTTPTTQMAVARRFSDIDRPRQARKILFSAYQQTPMNQLILTELIRVELDLGNTENLNKLLTKLLQMRRPQMELLTDAYRKLGSDRFIFTPDRENLLIELSSILREQIQEFPES